MTFDDSRAIPEMGAAHNGAEAFFKSKLALPEALDAGDQRRDRIHRALNVAAMVLFGAFGALAGAALVVLMLVALVIPATTSFVLAGVAATVALFAIALWVKRRADAAIDKADASPLEHLSGVPV